jgi:hypothetical protein
MPSAWASTSKNGDPTWTPMNAAIGEIEKLKTLLIRAEDKNRWERRAPLVPADLADILEDTGARAFVEDRTNAFSAWTSTRQPGPHCEGMADGDVILGVKEIPVEKFWTARPIFFSPTPSRASRTTCRCCSASSTAGRPSSTTRKSPTTRAAA